jgi:gliding motility-associated-like protein
MRFISVFLICLWFPILGFTQITDSVCAGKKGRNYYVTNNPLYTYQWNIKGGNITSGNKSNQIAIDWDTIPGIYPIKVVALNQLSCQGDTTTTFVKILPKSTYQLIYPSLVCQGALVTAEVIAKDKNIKVKWQDSSTNKYFRFTPQKDTSIYVKIKGGCLDELINIPIKVDAKPVASFSQNPRLDSLLEGDSLTFYSNSSPINADLKWLLFDSIPNDKQYDKLDVTFPLPKTYKIGLRVSTKAGCTDSIFKTITVYPDEHLYIPNSFTPNGDGINDKYLVYIKNPLNFSLKIYDRWGGIVFETNDPTKSWDGTMKGDILPLGVYTGVMSFEKQGIGNKNIGFTILLAR